MDESSKFSTLHSDLESANRTIFSLKEELRRIQEQQQNDASMRCIESQWKDKYTEIHQELMETLNRENELQCLLDEESIKLKSAKREVDYLETLIADQGNTKNIRFLNPKPSPHAEEDLKVRVQSSVSTIPQIEEDPIQPVYHQNETETVGTESAARSTNGYSKEEEIRKSRNVNINTRPTPNAINHQFARKYEELELDLKKRLRMQAMLETDSRKLTHHTKHFFDQLNQQKNETSQVFVY